MKVAFCNRPTWNEPLGGDGIQMIKTKEALERLYNVEICIITEPRDLSNNFDLVHIFNYATVTITEAFFKRAISLNLKIASSSIFWEYKYAITPFSHRLGFVHGCVSKSAMNMNVYFNSITSHLLNFPYLLSSSFKRKVLSFIEMSDIVLPNSLEESKLLMNLNSMKGDSLSDKMHIVYNGVDVCNVSILSKDVFFEKYKIPQDYILQVSRIQYIKNQLNLLYALAAESNIPIVLVGKIIEKSYYVALQRIAKKRGNVFFIEEIPHDDVYSFYRYARCHVLLSFRESPGLVSLEALSQGCPAVVSDNRFAPVGTYFDDNVEVVNPLSLRDIHDGVIRAYNRTRVSFDINKFSWDNVATQTYNAYQSLF